MARDTYATITARVRQIADDRDQSGGTIFPDTDLLPIVNAHLLDLSIDLANGGAAFMKGTQTINLTSGTDTAIVLNGTAGGVNFLNADFILPIRLWEKQTGTADSTYVDMNEQMERLPDIDPSYQLRFWSWDSGQLNLLGATQNNTVRISYERQLTPFSAPTDPLPIPGATNVLAYATLKSVAASRGEQDGMAWADSMYQKAYEQLKRIYVKGNQRRGRRRVPYGTRTPYRY